VKSVVLISIDCLRADCAGYVEDAKLKPPCITHLAKEGYAYENCIVHAPFTTTSHASMLSGLYPFEHGVRHLRGERLSSDIRMIQHDLKVRGYSTYGLVSCYHMSHIGLHHGFDEYRFEPDVVNDDKGRRIYTTAETLTERALRILSNKRPVFLFLHYFDAHVHIGFEYEQLYYEEILNIDKQIERLISYCNKETLFVITGDHGKKWSGEHNFPYLNPRNSTYDPHPCGYQNVEGGHGAELYDECVRVPLIVYNGSQRPSDTKSLVQSIDIPNIIKSEIDERTYQLNREFAYMETFSPDQIFKDAIPLIGIRTNKWKLICYQKKRSGNNRSFVPAELYNLEADPKETENLIEHNKDISRKLGNDLMRILSAKRPSHSPEPIEDEEYKKTIEERLRAMGYI